MDAKSGTKAGDELDVLTTLVEAYEAKHLPSVHPIRSEAIKFRMDQLGMIRKISKLAWWTWARLRS